MRSILFMAALVFMALASHAQTPNTVINCWITNGRPNFGHLEELLPDSIQANVLVDPRKKFNIRDGNKMLLWFEQHGWKLIGVDTEASGSNGNVSSSPIYILAKEIYLDDSARALFLRKLEEK